MMNKKHRMFVRMVGASLIRRRSRMIVALLAIVVGATILSGLGMIYYDVPRQMSAQFRSYGANIIFVPEAGEAISPETVRQGVAVFPQDKTEGFTPYRYENSTYNDIPVTLAGTDFDSVMKTSPYWHITGELPRQDGQALIGKKVAERFDLQTGSSMKLMNSFEVTEETDTSKIPDYEIVTDPQTGEKFCDHELDLKIAGILETGGPEEES